MFGIQPVFEDLAAGLYRFQPLLPNILAVSLTGLFLIDTVVSVKAALSIGNRLEQLEKLGAVLKEHLENLELPTEDILLRLESAYDKRAAKKRAAQSSRQARLDAWRTLTPEEKKRHVAGLVAELQRRQEELFRSRFQQQRLLRAFPRMRRTDAGKGTGKNRLLDEWRNRLNKK